MATVLIIDDNADVLFLMAHFVTSCNHTPVTANGGATGVSKAQQYRPNLVLCDLQMPDVSGYNVIALLRQDPVLRLIPVVAMTAHGAEASEKALAAGFDVFIEKPIVWKLLARHIELLLARKQADIYV